MNRRDVIGWVFVVIQFVLLIALIVVPGGSDWARPGWLRVASTALVVAGVALVGVSALGLGAALTPTPVPTERGQLVTGGLYRFVRHPIYSGVLAVVLGLVAGSGRWLMVALGVLTIAFFTVKARWEEARLAEAYPDYADYAARTPRFVPNPFRRG